MKKFALLGFQWENFLTRSRWTIVSVVRLLETFWRPPSARSWRNELKLRVSIFVGMLSPLLGILSRRSHTYRRDHAGPLPVSFDSWKPSGDCQHLCVILKERIEMENVRLTQESWHLYRGYSPGAAALTFSPSSRR